MTFPSAVDGWFYLVIVFTTAVIGWTWWVAAQESNTALLHAVMLGSALLAVGLPIWMIVSTSYTVTDDALDVRCGPFRWHVERQSIRAIEPSRSPLSSPALSLKRIRVVRDGAPDLLVSPADRAGFARALGLELDEST